MSYHINPTVGGDYASQLSKDLFWFKERNLTNKANTKLKEDKKNINDATVYVIYNINSDFNYYILVNNNHDLLFDTADFDEMFFYIEHLKNS